MFGAGPASERIVLVPFLLRQILHKRVESLVHPRPLALVRIDDHGEEVVAHFVDDHPDHAILDALGVGAILLGPSEVEADHRVFHADGVRMDRYGHGIGIVNGVLGIDLQRVFHRAGAVLFPQRIALFRVIAHGHHLLATDVHRHRIPDEFSAGGKTEIADVLGLIDPCLLGGGAAAFVLGRFILFDDDDGLRSGVLGLVVARKLRGGQHLTEVLTLARGGHNMVGRHGEVHGVVAKRKGKFTLAEKLLVLPALHLVVNAHAGKKLGDGVEVILILRKILVARTAPDLHPVVDIVPPLHLDAHLASGLQCGGQVHTHHGVHHGRFQAVAGSIFHIFHFETTVKVPFQPFEVVGAHLVIHLLGGGLLRVAVLGTHVLIHLQPQIVEHIGRIVGVSDGRRTVDALLIVQLDVHHIVGLLLIVFVAGRPACRAIGRWSGQILLQLTELAFVLGGSSEGGCEENQIYQNGHLPFAIRHAQFQCFNHFQFSVLFYPLDQKGILSAIKSPKPLRPIETAQYSTTAAAGL
jgi:hypothetical protein